MSGWPVGRLKLLDCRCEFVESSVGAGSGARCHQQPDDPADDSGEQHDADDCFEGGEDPNRIRDRRDVAVAEAGEGDEAEVVERALTVDDLLCGFERCRVGACDRGEDHSEEHRNGEVYGERAEQGVGRDQPLTKNHDEDQDRCDDDGVGAERIRHANQALAGQHHLDGRDHDRSNGDDDVDDRNPGSDFGSVQREHERQGGEGIVENAQGGTAECARLARDVDRHEQQRDDQQFPVSERSDDPVSHRRPGGHRGALPSDMAGSSSAVASSVVGRTISNTMLTTNTHTGKTYPSGRYTNGATNMIAPAR